MRLRFLGGLAAILCASIGFAQFPAEVLDRQLSAMKELQGNQPDVRFLTTGGVLDRVYGAAFAGGFTMEDAAKNFMVQSSDLFCANDGEFVYDRMQPMGFGGFTVAYFDEFVGGYRVEGAGVSVLVKQQLGNPVVLAVNNSRCVNSAIPQPSISAEQAIEKFRKEEDHYVLFGKPELVVWVDEESQHLAWKFTADNDMMTMPMVVTAFVDAVTGKIVHQRNEVYELDVNGSVKGWVSPGQRPDVATNPEVLAPLPYVLVQIAGGNQAYADINGNFNIANAGLTPVTVNAGLVGRWSNVVTAQGTNQTGSLSVTPPGPADFVFGSSLGQFDVAQTNAYLQVSRVHDFIKAQSPSYPGVDVPIVTNVNIVNTCNANFQSANQTINFFHAGGACPNTAYSSVVHHEYGHFVINRAGTAQGGYGEGMSDTISALLADDPCLGLEFNSPGCLRHAINSIHYPENAGSAVHTAGQMVSGAFWETVVAFESTTGHADGLQLMRRLAVNSILLRPPGITPGLTVDVLTLDDDDTNLGNGTPHYDEIAEGFGNKGLFAPTLQWLVFENQGSPTEFFQFDPNNDVGIPIQVHAIANVNSPVPSTAQLHFRVNGGTWQTGGMIEYADEAFMYGLIDQPACGDIVEWYMSIEDTQGHVMNYPSGGQSSPFRVLVALAVENILVDTFETNLGWTVTNTALTAGGWTRVDPVGTTNAGQQANPENDSNDTGALCFATGQGAAGGAAGTADVDGGPTELVSPVIDLSGGDALLSYNRWFYSANGVPDTFTVSISNNGGATWTTLETVSGIQNSWTRREFRVGAFVTPTNNVRVRFSAIDNPNDSITEAAVDNVQVRRIICP